MGNYTDNMTLDEIKDNDLAMVEHAIKNAHRYRFTNQQKAMLFIRHCMDTTLKRLGVNVSPPKDNAARMLYARTLDKEMKDKDIQIENRSKYRGNDLWRNGIYIFKNGELAAFISNVMGNMREAYSSKTMKLSSKRLTEIYVITNARTDLIQRVYSV